MNYPKHITKENLKKVRMLLTKQDYSTLVNELDFSLSHVLKVLTGGYYNAMIVSKAIELAAFNKIKSEKEKEAINVL